MAGLGLNEPGGHEGHATSKIRDPSKKGRETAHQTDHGIRPGARAMYGLPTITPKRTGEVVTNVERSGSAGTDQEHQVLVTQIRRGHGVSSRSVPHASPSIHAFPEGGLQ